MSSWRLEKGHEGSRWQMFCFPEYARLCVMQHVSGMPPHRVWSQGPEKVGFFRALFSDSTSVSVSVETGDQGKSQHVQVCP